MNSTQAFNKLGYLKRGVAGEISVLQGAPLLPRHSAGSLTWFGDHRDYHLNDLINFSTVTLSLI
jgi:hypothetical protein